MKHCVGVGTMRHIEKNGSGYADETVTEVIEHEFNIKKRDKEDYEYRQMRKKIKHILEDSGYILDGPISLINEKSGRKKRIY